MDEELQERFGLAVERIGQIAVCAEREGVLGIAFQEEAVQLLKSLGKESSTDVSENIRQSGAEPADKNGWRFSGTGFDLILELLFTDLSSVRIYADRKDWTMVVLLLELFLEVFFLTGEEDACEQSLQNAVYWTANDYAKEFSERVLNKNPDQTERMAYNSFEQLALDCVSLINSSEAQREAFYKQVPYKSYVLYFNKRLVEQMITAVKAKMQK